MSLWLKSKVYALDHNGKEHIAHVGSGKGYTLYPNCTYFLRGKYAVVTQK